MRTRRLGESALIVDELGSIPAWQFAERLHEFAPTGMLDAAASYQSVGVFFDPDQIDFESLVSNLEVCLATGEHQTRSQNFHRIPVCYEIGQDLDDVCSQLRLTRDEVIQLHTQATYTCAAVGFQPGFGYLGDLPEALRGIPRRSSPRVRVPAGSVAITGKQTAVYPSESPGGWALIGRTPLQMVDVGDGYFPVRAGDSVEFYPVSAEEFESRRGERL